MEGDSILIAIWLLTSAWLILVYASGRTRRWLEVALNLAIMAAMGLLLAGYDPTVPWTFLVDGSAIACASAMIFGLVRYARRELAEGEYDEPSEAS